MWERRGVSPTRGHRGRGRHRSTQLAELDLDVVKYLSGHLDVLDREEFDQNLRLFGYPEDVVQQAEST